MEYKLKRFDLVMETCAEYSIEYPYLNSGHDVFEFCINKLKLHKKINEIFGLFCVDAKNRVIAYSETGIGSTTSCSVDISSLYRKALIAGAASIICVHNHPSGDPTPSEYDIAVTERIKKAGDLLNLELLDHIVIGDRVYCSMREQGML